MTSEHDTYKAAVIHGARPDLSHKPEQRISAQIENYLNEWAPEGFVLDQIVPLAKGISSERALVVMRMQRVEVRTEVTHGSSHRYGGETLDE